MAIGFIFLLLLIAATVAGVILIALLCMRRKPQPVTIDLPEQTNPVDRKQRRTAILEKLSQKEISQNEAERQLLELDNPVPAEMPPPPAPQKNHGCGCLIATVIALALIGLLILALGLFGVERRQTHKRAIIHHLESLNHQP